ncbi:hypothetical protein MNB_SV-3-159 [hydrothermal vent metagenome]|uniref:Excalibur calcium-binding domain-containing protein n=1 Tax=hydrothermal vent metagenome TaxID=652676 RepID=A0A1W1BRC4_9ZZZZ
MKKTIITMTLLIGISTVTYAKKTCNQFKTWQEANIYFKAKKSGYKSLDRNHDGKPCEALWEKSLNKEKRSTRIRIYQYGSPASYGKSFSSMSACERERAKLAKSNMGTDYSYKCEAK